VIIRLGGIMTQTSVGLRLPVRGMHCAACSSRIERIVGKMPGVAGASVNLATEELSVRFDPARISLADMAESVGKAGFSLELPSPQVRPDGLSEAGARWERHHQEPIAD
jgi:Cu+-exporting ATPase